MRLLATIPVGMLDTNCYFVGEQSSYIVVDPGGDVQRIVDCVEKQETGNKKQGIQPKAIVCTHAHYDHIGAVAALKKKYGIPVYMHESEKEVLEAMFTQFGVERFTVDGWLKDGDLIQISNDTFQISNGRVEDLKFEIGNLSLRVLHTPGHTPGGMCLIAEDFIITGDTVFADGYLGRTDLPGGSDRLIQSSMRKVFALNKDLTVYPGHGPASTIEREKRFHHIS